MNQTAIGKFIAQKRREKNLTQEQLAEKIGVSNKTVSKWENGRSMPDYSVIEALCSALGITVPELLGEEKRDGDALKILNEMKRLRNKKMLLIGCVFIFFGIVHLVFSQVLGTTDFQTALSGVMLGLSVPEMLLGVFLILLSLRKKR